MRSFCIVIMALIALIFLGCSDELDLAQPATDGSDTTIIIKPEPEPPDSIYVVRGVDLAVSPCRNDDHETVATGIAGEITADVYVYVEWRSSAKSDLTFRVDNQPYALPDPMLRPADGWTRFTGVKVGNIVNLALTMDKGSAKKPESGSDQKNANKVVKIVFTTVGLREP